VFWRRSQRARIAIDPPHHGTQ